MGRKIKASIQEKIKAVEDYLNGIHSMSQIATTLKVTRVTVREWIRLYETIGAAKKNPDNYKNLSYASLVILGSFRKFCRMILLHEQSK